MTSCDKLWLKINRGRLVFLVCTLPVVLIWPVSAIWIIGVALFISCRSFLIFCRPTNDNDAFRFIMTMPFSRKEIFKTYIKGILFISLGCLAVIAALRSLLLLSGFSYSKGWNSVFTVSGLIKYLMILLLTSLIAAIFQASLIKDYSQNRYDTFFCVFVFAVPIGLFIVYHLKTAIWFLSGLAIVISRLENNRGYSSEEVLELGMPAQIAGIIAIVLYFVLIIGFFVLMKKGIEKAKISFCGENSHV